MAQPLSIEFLLERGYCCGNKCVNCPYTPKYQRGNREINPVVSSYMNSKK